MGKKAKVTQAVESTQEEVTKKKTAKKADKKGGKPKKASTRISKSGKFKSIRHLMESLLSKTPKLEYKKAEEAVLREYPNSKFKATHFGWYKNKIQTHKETKTR